MIRDASPRKLAKGNSVAPLALFHSFPCHSVPTPCPSQPPFPPSPSLPPFPHPHTRHANTARSPWTSKYTPPLEDGVQPSDSLRALEMAANSAFDQYREQYYEGGVSSCYFWDNEGGFACCIVIKKSTPPKAHIVDEDADPR